MSQQTLNIPVLARRAPKHADKEGAHELNLSHSTRVRKELTTAVTLNYVERLPEKDMHASYDMNIVSLCAATETEMQDVYILLFQT